MKRKQGISLIVLVITIIVTVVLAASVVITLSNSSVIDKANYAVEQADLKQVQQLASMAWADAYTDGKITKDELEQAVNEILRLNKIDTSKYIVTVTTGGVTVTSGDGTNNITPNEPVMQGIWKVANMYETLDNSYYTSAYVKVESTYNHPTLKEYKEQYILKALAEDVDEEIVNLITLDDFILLTFEMQTMEQVLEAFGEELGVTVTRDELVYTYLLQTTDADTFLQSLGYSVENIENEYNKLSKTEVVSEDKNKTYVITFPDGTVDTVSGEDLDNYVGRGGINSESVPYITINDGISTIKINFTLDKCVPATIEDAYYTFTFSVEGYTVTAKDKTLSTYGKIEAPIQGVPIVLRATFLHCENLTEAPEIPAGVTIMTDTFNGCKNLKIAPNLPEGLVDLSAAFAYCENLVVVPEIPSTVTDMGSTFYGCKKITVAPKLPKGLKSIHSTFWGCESLIEAPEIPSTVTRVECAFKDCINLTKATKLPEEITDMTATFSGCEKLLEAPEIPANVINMNGTFSNCKSITKAPAIPNKVENLSVTFNGCTNLETAPIVPASVTNLNNVFSDCPKLSGRLYINSITLTDATTALLRTATEGNGLTVVVPNDSVREKIISESFYDWSNDKITIVKE